MSHLPIQTKRLCLRRWRPSDTKPFAEMCADPAVMQYIGAGNIMTMDQVRADIVKYEECWTSNGFGQCAVELLSTGEFIGFTGLDLHRLFPEFADMPEIGWRIARRHWGQGLATETAQAVIDFAKADRKLDSLIGVCQRKNIASERIMQRIGMSFLRDDIAPNNGRLIKIYTLQTP